MGSNNTHLVGLSGNSKRNEARADIAIGIAVAIASILLSICIAVFIDHQYALFGLIPLIYAAYKILIKGFLKIWIYRE